MGEIPKLTKMYSPRETRIFVPPVPALGEHSEDICHVQHPSYGVVCTRKRGHLGLHEAAMDADDDGTPLIGLAWTDCDEVRTKRLAKERQ